MWRDTIMVEEDNCIFATGSNVWMNAGEIADLFNITAASVNRAIKRMLKADVLNDYEVLKLVRLDNGLLMEFYSLELIIVLSYKWNTFYTSLFRKWIMKRMFESRKEIIPMFLSSAQSGKGGSC
ncbi:MULTISPECIES: hypothetical protein [Bacteroides]|uniref:hypothetical protein n=1 Tax=Bacteroides TaxID=816 RepID=UPI0026DED262|nr:MULTISPECIES: hypothetical protein [Bacteroides]MCS2261994.1 hypothetical protein [Bacteroides thetaiotaomicron]MDO5421028.1 hypothetical protein [Bacteroides sp.]